MLVILYVSSIEIVVLLLYNIWDGVFTMLEAFNTYIQYAVHTKS